MIDILVNGRTLLSDVDTINEKSLKDVDEVEVKYGTDQISYGMYLAGTSSLAKGGKLVL